VRLYVRTSRRTDLILSLWLTVLVVPFVATSRLTWLTILALM